MNPTTRSSARLAFALLAAAFAAPLSAAQFCVSTGADLQQDLAIAANNNTDDVFKIEQGVMTAPDRSRALWLYFPGAADMDNRLEISGGWSTEGTCNTQTENPALTVLDAELKAAVIAMQPNQSGQLLTNYIKISNLTLKGGRSDGSAAGSALGIDFSGSGLFANYVVDRVVVTGCDDSWATPVFLQLKGAGGILFRNSVVAGNAFHGTQFPGGLWVTTTVNAYSLLTNNSIHDNVSTETTIRGVRVDGDAELTNNVVADNPNTFPGETFEIYSGNGGSIELYSNHFGSRRFVGGLEVDAATTVGDAIWNKVGLHRVAAAGSPLRDSGNNTPLGQLATLDVLGNSRINGGIVDRGAIETGASTPTLFANGFD